MRFAVPSVGVKGPGAGQGAGRFPVHSKRLGLAQASFDLRLLFSFKVAT
jgi:hypothetical protein